MFIDVFFKSAWSNAFAILLLLATVTAAIVTVVKQHHSDLPKTLKTIPWFILACPALFFLTLFGIFLVIKQGTANLELSQLKGPLKLAMMIVSTTISLATGSLGLFWLRKFRSANPLPPPITIAPPGELSDKI
jgi:heme/copper-type cytochrome/quinol oxidase subunit 3